jgi:hypothetical protein
MKKTNIKTFLICISFSLLVFSCINDDNNTSAESNLDSYSSLNDVIQAIKPEAQSFTVNPTIEQIKTGADGTVIQIFGNAFTDDDGNLISTPITMTLTEYLTLGDMILGNVQTTSNNQLLVTGGSFNLVFEDENGSSVNVNPSNIEAFIPVQTDITGFENQMQYYIREFSIVEGREVVNWDLSQNSEAWMDTGGFIILGLLSGLTNCDVLYDMAGDTPTQFGVPVSGVTNYENTIVWLVIDDFPSVAYG